jgi:hypothetical protein
VSHGAIQFAVYEELKSAAQGFAGFTRPLVDSEGSGSEGNGRRGSSSSKRQVAAAAAVAAAPRELSPAEITACGALSKLVASVATYPSQARGGRCSALA